MLYTPLLTQTLLTSLCFLLWQSINGGISAGREGRTEDSSTGISSGGSGGVGGGGGGAGGGASMKFSSGSSFPPQQRAGARPSPSLQSLQGNGPIPSVRSVEDVAADWLEQSYRVVIDRAKPVRGSSESFHTKSRGSSRSTRIPPFIAGGGSRGEAAAMTNGAGNLEFPGGMTRRQGSWKNGIMRDAAGDRPGAAGPEPSARWVGESRKTAEWVAGRSAQALRRGLGGEKPTAASATWQPP